MEARLPAGDRDRPEGLAFRLMAEHGPDQAELDRLTADLRVMDANGIERAAWGWDRHERGGLDRAPAAERAALAATEQQCGGGVGWPGAAPTAVPPPCRTLPSAPRSPRSSSTMAVRAGRSSVACCSA